MILDNLYKTILLEPAKDLIKSELFIVSGYATATFARRHLVELVKKDCKVNLIVGMPANKNDHEAYLQLHKEFEGQFKGYYLSNSIPVHSKIYAWFDNGEPKIGYSGSANYSQYGFFETKQINQMVIDNPLEIKTFFDQLIQRSQYMPNVTVETKRELRLPAIAGSVPAGQVSWIESGVSVRISLLDRDGKVPAKSGLNWGQREGRNKDQAYLSIKGDVRGEEFLPERKFTFTLITDDGVSMDCVVAQDGRKAIQTTYNNSELGLYFRERLGLPSGAFITVEDLERYGRTDFTLVKIDDENFQLDFSLDQTSS